jgi:hypothetical protein
VKRYTARAKTAYEHAWEIRDAYGFRAFEDPGAAAGFRLFLEGRAWTHAEGPYRLFGQAAGWLRRTATWWLDALLQRDGHPTALGEAIAMYGRIFKSLHILSYTGTDETYRRDIKGFRNLQEGRHALARKICHGRKGEL